MTPQEIELHELLLTLQHSLPHLALAHKSLRGLLCDTAEPLDADDAAGATSAMMLVEEASGDINLAIERVQQIQQGR